MFVAGFQLEQPTLALLQEWYPTFIKQICTDIGIEPIDSPQAKNYTTRNKFDTLSGEDIPKVVVISPGLVGSPAMSGQGQFRATWRLGIGVATAATDEETAKLHCDIYGAAAREIMLKYAGRTLGGQIHWLDEQYVDLPISNQLQQFRAASIWFSIDVENVARKRGGPEVPDKDPYAYGTAKSVGIQITKEPFNG